MDAVILQLQIDNVAAAAEELVNANVPRQFWSKWRRDDSNPFECLNDQQFVKLFRLSKRVTEELIQEINPFLIQPTRRSSITPEFKVLTALKFFASGSYQTDVSLNKFVTVSQSTVSRSVNEVVRALNNPRVFNNWVKFSMNPNNLDNMRTRFYQKYGIPGIIGVVDCTHVAIFPPPNEHVYVNRKRYHSLNAQLICDIDLCILNVNARFPGSTHDSHIWRNSNICTALENASRNNNFNYYVIGDSGYPLRKWIQVPVPAPPPESPEALYNEAFKKARCLIERCNGLLKARFRCLLKHRVLHYTPPVAGQIINACCVLHNMCILNNVPVPEPEEGDRQADFGIYNEPDINQNIVGRNRRDPDLEAGENLRNNIIRNYF